MQEHDMADKPQASKPPDSGGTKPQTDPIGGEERLRRMLMNILEQKGEDATGDDPYRVAVFDPDTGALLFASSVVQQHNQSGAAIESQAFGPMAMGYLFALEDVLLAEVRSTYGTTFYGPTVWYNSSNAAAATNQLRDYSSMRQGWNVGIGTPSDQWTDKRIMAGAPTIQPYSVNFATLEMAKEWFGVVLEFVDAMWSQQA
jgi:hypothetical protein